jgi:N-acetylneuraminic acid mutarotase
VAALNGVLYTVGGDPAGTVEAYDPVTNTWTTKQPMLTPRSGFVVGVVSGILYAIGGATGTDAPPSTTVILNTVEAYDPATNTWTIKAPMPTARRSLSVGVLNSVLYTIGGQATFPGDYTGTNEAYLP